MVFSWETGGQTMTIKMIRHTSLAVLALLASGCAGLPTTTITPEEDKAALISLNAELFETMIVAGDPTRFNAVAIDDFHILAPGGVIEGKAQSVAGLGAWNVQDIKLSNEQVTRSGDVAIVFGRLDINGTMKPIGRWGPIKFSSTFQKQDDEWRLVGRSLTPCLPKVVEIGRC
jgi:ketosteroid isomerase-like protein